MRRVILPILILIVGFALAAGIVVTGPTLEQQAPPPNSPLVRTWVAQPQTIQLSTRTHGTVLPRTESDLIPEVSGRVVEIASSMVSGGFFKKGDILLQIDQLDYQVALRQAQATLESSQSELLNAERAYNRQIDLARKQSTSESLRDEALNRYRVAQARLKEAEAKLERARRDLHRTKITAPYDGRVRQEQVDVGQFVNRGSPIAKLYATDFAEVRLPVHDHELEFLNIPLNGLPPADGSYPVVTLGAKFGGKHHEWEGSIVRTEGELDPQTRMINIVAQVAAPYETVDDKPPLAVGLFVEAEIAGRQVEEVFVIPRTAIQTNEQVYVVSEQDRLEFRDVEILRTVDEDVYVVAGFSANEVVSLSRVNNAVDGMIVRRANLDITVGENAN